MDGPQEVEVALARALEGDEAAWVRLLGLLWDRVDDRARRSRYMGQLRGSIDDRREVVSRVFARLRRNNLRALRTFPAWRERNPEKTIDDWLAILVTNVIRDYVRERLGDIDASGNGLKRMLHTLASSLDVDADGARRPAMTDAIAATELLSVARSILPAEQASALASWLAGGDFEEIATAHGWPDGRAARGKVRAALARLRRELRDETAAEVTA
jgi:hypothetical protein